MSDPMDDLAREWLQSWSLDYWAEEKIAHADKIAPSLAALLDRVRTDTLGKCATYLEAVAEQYGVCATFGSGDDRAFFKKMQIELKEKAQAIRSQ